HGGEAAFGDGFFPGRDVTIVLRVGILNAADGGDAHAVAVGADFGGITLKISVQGAVLLRNGKFVTGLGEMVHANVEIASFEKLEQARSKDFEFLHAFREMRGEGTLLLL